MKQKEKAAPHCGTTQITCLAVDEVHFISPFLVNATKIELVACHLLSNGPMGTSALSGLAGLQDLNFRNSISELRRHHGITILDEFFDHQHSGGGLTRLKRYWLADRDEARKVAELVNHKRKQRGAALLRQKQIAHYLSAFPSNTGPIFAT